MTLAFSVKGINPKKLDVTAIRTELINELKKEGKLQVSILDRTTRNWKREKPTFKYIVDISGSSVDLLVGPSGNKKGAQKWEWLDEGTEPHLISAKRAPHLRFRLGYNAATRPQWLNSRGHYYIGNWWRTASVVRHPGIQAREWSMTLQKQRKVPFRNAMLAALRRGIARSTP